jgi:hypothetical protein
VTLEHLFRRLPRVIRQLRSRHDDRPPFRVEDERDLEDLMRSLLPLHFDDVRPHSRTPGYADRTCTDFLLASEKIVVLAKSVEPRLRGGNLGEQIREDVTYWETLPSCRILMGFVYDPECLLRDGASLETVWSTHETRLEVRWVIGAC